VTASSQRKLETGAGLGADLCINYEEESIEAYVEWCTGGEGFDLVFDTVAGENLRRSIEAVRLNGAVATVGAAGENLLRPAQQKGLSLHFMSMLIPMLHDFDRAHHGEILEWTTSLVEEGHLRPLVDDRTSTFDEIGDAHAYVEAGEQIGKVVVRHPDA